MFCVFFDKTGGALFKRQDTVSKLVRFRFRVNLVYTIWSIPHV